MPSAASCSSSLKLFSIHLLNKRRHRMSLAYTFLYFYILCGTVLKRRPFKMDISCSSFTLSITFTKSIKQRERHLDLCLCIVELRLEGRRVYLVPKAYKNQIVIRPWCKTCFESLLWILWSDGWLNLLICSGHKLYLTFWMWIWISTTSSPQTLHQCHRWTSSWSDWHIILRISTQTQSGPGVLLFLIEMVAFSI